MKNELVTIVPFDGSNSFGFQGPNVGSVQSSSEYSTFL